MTNEATQKSLFFEHNLQFSIIFWGSPVNFRSLVPGPASGYVSCWSGGFYGGVIGMLAPLYQTGSGGYGEDVQHHEDPPAWIAPGLPSGSLHGAGGRPQGRLRIHKKREF